jgi:nicotinamidase-related amidase
MSADTPWLVLIDLQVVFADPDSPWATPGFDDILPAVHRMVEAAGERTTYTRFIAPEVVDGAWRAYYEEWPFALQPPSSPTYQLIDQLSPGDRPVVSLPTFGKWGQELDQAVAGSRDIVLAGVSTDCCVISTTLSAADAGVHVRVVGDACRGLSDQDHRRALDVMRLYAPLVEVIDTETAVRLLAEGPPGTAR